MTLLLRRVPAEMWVTDNLFTYFSEAIPDWLIDLNKFQSTYPLEK